jgi:signal transduction histidine kinase
MAFVIPAIVLAAGRSSRMGRPKATLPVSDSHTFLTRIVRTFLDSGVDDVIVTTMVLWMKRASAGLSGELRGDMARAADCLERVLAVAPADEQAHDALELFYRSTQEWAVLIDNDGPVVNFYGPGRMSFRLADKTRVTLTQETGYPSEGEIKLTLSLDTQAEFEALCQQAIALRKIGRAEEALASSGSEAEYRAALERTIEESDGLIRTFNALLMIARAESGQARGNMDDFDAADVAKGIHELYEPLAEDVGMTLRVKTSPVRLHGNRELISQALANLVENAIKYGKPVPAAQPLGAAATAGSKEILIEARREGEQVLLSVTDHGPGIPEGDRKHAVERFVRLEASRTQPGSGLGLSLASAVATLHGGELRLGDSRPGLTATLAIPALAASGDRLAAQTLDVPQKVA